MDDDMVMKSFGLAGFVLSISTVATMRKSGLITEGAAIEAFSIAHEALEKMPFPGDPAICATAKTALRIAQDVALAASGTAGTQPH